MPDITPPDPSKSLHGPHSPGNPHLSVAAETPDWASSDLLRVGPGRLWAIPESPTITRVGLDLPAGCRFTETDLASIDAVIEASAQSLDAFSMLTGIDQLGDAYRHAWAELRPLLEQRLCDCNRNPHHRWNCPATPIWAQTIRDLDCNPWTCMR